MQYSIIDILLIEDNLAEARLLRELLSESEKDLFNILHVPRLQEGIKQLEKNENYDLVLLDLSLPDSQGLNSLKPINEIAPNLPIVVLTNTEDEELSINAVRQGAQDYLVKRLINQDLLIRSIRYAIERKQIQQTLKKTNQELTHLNHCLQEEINKRQEIQEELERSNRELEQFAYIVSHDLKQPLTTIYSWTQMLQRRYETIFDAKGKKYLDFIFSGTQKMNSLIDSLLTYSRVGRQAKHLETVNCNLLLTEVKETLKTAIAKSQAKITHSDLPTLIADPIQLGQLFQNLIDNAIKYRREENPKIHIAAKLNTSTRNSKNSQEWIFSFQDNGLGIPQEDQDRVFEIFRRLHSDDQYSGNGVGLAICQKIVQRHNGNIWIESQVGEGSTFYFSIPHLENNLDI
jgi:two-component system, sensor histidine kinase and response regulator